MGDDSLMNGYWGRQRRKGRHEVLGVACLCLAGFCRFVTSQEGREVSTQNIPHVSRDSGRFRQCNQCNQRAGAPAL